MLARLEEVSRVGQTLLWINRASPKPLPSKPLKRAIEFFSCFGIRAVSTEPLSHVFIRQLVDLGGIHAASVFGWFSIDQLPLLSFAPVPCHFLGLLSLLLLFGAY